MQHFFKFSPQFTCRLSSEFGFYFVVFLLLSQYFTATAQPTGIVSSSHGGQTAASSSPAAQRMATASLPLTTQPAATASALLTTQAATSSTLTPQAATQFYFKGKQAYDADSLQQAVVLYTNALAGNMDKPYMGYIARGVAYMRMAFFKNALADFNAARDLQVDRSEPLLCCAQANLALRNYDDAIKNCTKALRINNLEDRAYQLRAQAYLENGNTLDAIEDFDRTLKLHPTAAGFNDRGFAKFLLGEVASAIVDFDQSIKLDKEFLAAYRNRAKARLNSGDKIGALEDYNSALDLAHDADTYTARGLLLHRLGEYTKAIADFEAALRINPYHSEARQAKEAAKTARSNRDTEKS